MTPKYTYRFPFAMLCLLAMMIPLIFAWTDSRLTEWSTYFVALLVGGATAFLVHCGIVGFARYQAYANSIDRDQFMSMLPREGLTIATSKTLQGPMIYTCPRHLFGLTRLYEGRHNLDSTRLVVATTQAGAIHVAHIRVYADTYGPEFNCEFHNWMAKAPIPMAAVS